MCNPLHSVLTAKVKRDVTGNAIKTMRFDPVRSGQPRFLGS
jgi:hypothetical protein